MTRLFGILITLTCLFSNVAFGQDVSTILTLGEDKLYSFEKIYEVPGRTKEQIFDALKSWTIKNIKSQSNTNYFDETGKSTVSTTPSLVCSFNSWVEFKLNIDIKDGKYKLAANAFVWQNLLGFTKSFGDYSQTNMAKKSKVKILNDVDENFKKMLTSIEQSAGKDSEW